jgi:hypothetical protein
MVLSNTTKEFNEQYSLLCSVYMSTHTHTHTHTHTNEICSIFKKLCWQGSTSKQRSGTTIR